MGEMLSAAWGSALLSTLQTTLISQPKRERGIREKRLVRGVRVVLASGVPL